MAAVLAALAGPAAASAAGAPGGSRPAAAAATVLVVAQAQPSGSGGKDTGESASTWHGVVAFLGWILLALAVCGFLVWTMFGRSRSSGDDTATAADPETAAAPAPGPAAVPGPAAAPDGDGLGHDLTVLAFDRADGAEHAYADVCGRAGDAPWMREIAFVECHHNGRVVVRGAFAGHYVDVEDVADAARQGTAESSIAEAVVGLAFGPPAYAAHLVAGAPDDGGAVMAAVRSGLPERTSGIVAVAPSRDADALVAAFRDRTVRVTRHRLSADEAEALAATVADAPPAA